MEKNKTKTKHLSFNKMFYGSKTKTKKMFMLWKKYPLSCSVVVVVQVNVVE
jgi:hypothetical protein